LELLENVGSRCWSQTPTCRRTRVSKEVVVPLQGDEEWGDEEGGGREGRGKMAIEKENGEYLMLAPLPACLPSILSRHPVLPAIPPNPLLSPS
jgi:hypothetical protein